MNKQEYAALKKVAEASQMIVYNLEVWYVIPDGKDYLKAHMKVLRNCLKELEYVQQKMMLEQEVHE